MSTTIKDVAVAAGVSVSTVSKVINNKGSISKETIDHVKQVIEDLHFTPNSRAVSFAKGTTKNVVFLTSLEKNEPYKNPHMFEIMDGVYNSLASSNYDLSLMDISSDSPAKNSVFTAINSGQADGIVVHGSAISEETARFITEIGFPHVIIGTPLIETQVCWVDTNHQLAGECAGDHLLSKGYHHIAFVGEKKGDFISAQRLKGVRNALLKRGYRIQSEDIYYNCCSVDSAREAAISICKKDNGVDAIVCENNIIALGVSYGLASLNISVPKDMAFLAFDMFPYANIIHPTPTIIDIDMYEMGFQAGETIKRKMDKPNLLVQSCTTLPLLIQGKST